MSVKIRFNSASVTGVVLAKVGNPQRDEPLQTSREVFQIAEEDRETLTAIFLKPFKNLIGHRFSHHSSLEQHEMNTCSTAIFASPDALLEKGIGIAKRLYAKSNHPNIKSGDLCISLVTNIEVNDQFVEGLCILKSESVVPFLSISARDGDLQLHTEQGIHPEKIDKGCLILNFCPEQGYYVLTFDRAGGESRFWVRDFLGVHAVPDAAYLTSTYTGLATSFMELEKPAAHAAAEENFTAASDALAYFEEKDVFDMSEFETEVLKSPEAVAKFHEHVAEFESEQGQALDKKFEISKKDVNKAKKKIGAVMKFDTGVEIRLGPKFSDRHKNVLERGFDDEKQMSFVKVYYNKEEAG
ncbi:MAG: nucleoid-associated protein [Verrucomicrobiota bacterium]